MDDMGGTDADVKARIGKARAAFIQLNNIWNSKEIGQRTKIKIFNSNVRAGRFCCMGLKHGDYR